MEMEYNNKVKILTLGDVTLKTKGGTNPFSKIEHLFKDADFVVINLETVIAKRSKKYPVKEKAFIMRVYEDELSWLMQYKDKFIFTMANNHIFDLGKEGYEDTVGFLSKNNFMFVPLDSLLAAEKKGLKLQFDAVYSGIKNNYKRIINMQAVSPDTCNLLSIHWGAENILIPSLQQIQLAQSIHQKGFDIILGHHSHTPQGCFLKNRKFCVFSLGNCNMIYERKCRRTERIGLAFELCISDIREISYKKIPIEMNAAYAPEELKEQKTVSLLNQLDILPVHKTEAILSNMKYRFFYTAHLSRIYICDNFFYGWLPRIRKYGAKHLVMMLRWFFTKTFVLSFLHLLFHHFSKASQIIKKIND